MTANLVAPEDCFRVGDQIGDRKPAVDAAPADIPRPDSVGKVEYRTVKRKLDADGDRYARAGRDVGAGREPRELVPHEIAEHQRAGVKPRRKPAVALVERAHGDVRRGQSE